MSMRTPSAVPRGRLLTQALRTFFLSMEPIAKEAGQRTRMGHSVLPGGLAERR